MKNTWFGEFKQHRTDFDVALDLVYERHHSIGVSCLVTYANISGLAPVSFVLEMQFSASKFLSSEQRVIV